MLFMLIRLFVNLLIWLFENLKSKIIILKSRFARRGNHHDGYEAQTPTYLL
jgi:hypothetical protein